MKRLIISTLLGGTLASCGNNPNKNEDLAAPTDQSEVNLIGNSPILGNWVYDCAINFEPEGSLLIERSFTKDGSSTQTLKFFKDISCSERFSIEEIQNLEDEYFRTYLTEGESSSDAKMYAKTEVAPMTESGKITKIKVSLGRPLGGGVTEIDQTYLFDGGFSLKTYNTFKIEDDKLFFSLACYDPDQPEEGCNQELNGESPETRARFFANFFFLRRS